MKCLQDAARAQIKKCSGRKIKPINSYSKIQGYIRRQNAGQYAALTASSFHHFPYTAPSNKKEKEYIYRYII